MTRRAESTYAEELRTRSPSLLTRLERAQLSEERAWERAHPEDVQRLDWCVGKRVALRKDMTTLDGSTLVAGSSFRVLMRVRDRLLALDCRDEPKVLQESWVRVLKDCSRAR